MCANLAVGCRHEKQPRRRHDDSVVFSHEDAGICRALVTNGLTQSLPQKVFCAGPMFRYERPQKGRYRQFHQIDVELIGSFEGDARDALIGELGAGMVEDDGLRVRQSGRVRLRGAAAW